MRRHLAAAATLLAGLSLLTVTACGAAVGQPKRTVAPPSSAPKTPKEALLAAAPDGSQGTFQCAITEPGMNASGPVDPTGKKLQWTTVYTDPKLGYQMTIVFLIIDPRTWMKVGFTHTEKVTGLPKLPKGWMLMDRAKLTGTGTEIAGFSGPDPANARLLFEAIVDATRATDGTYQGTLDLTRAKQADVVDEDGLTALGDKAKSVPFRATLDGAKRLTSVTVSVPAAGDAAAHDYHISYTGYGAPTTIDPPAANQVQAAPAEAYALFT